jgi:hypothetical protein
MTRDHRVGPARSAFALEVAGDDQRAKDAVAAV